MARKRYKPEEIVAKLRQVDVLVSQGQNMVDAIRQIGACYFRPTFVLGVAGPVRRHPIALRPGKGQLSRRISPRANVLHLPPANPAEGATYTKRTSCLTLDTSSSSTRTNG